MEHLLSLLNLANDHLQKAKKVLAEAESLEPTADTSEKIKVFIKDNTDFQCEVTFKREFLIHTLSDLVQLIGKVGYQLPENMMGKQDRHNIVRINEKDTFMVGGSFATVLTYGKMYSLSEFVAGLSDQNFEYFCKQMLGNIEGYMNESKNTLATTENKIAEVDHFVKRLLKVSEEIKKKGVQSVSS